MGLEPDVVSILPPFVSIIWGLHLPDSSGKSCGCDLDVLLEANKATLSIMEIFPTLGSKSLQKRTIWVLYALWVYMTAVKRLQSPKWHVSWFSYVVRVQHKMGNQMKFSYHRLILLPEMFSSAESHVHAEAHMSQLCVHTHPPAHTGAFGCSAVTFIDKVPEVLHLFFLALPT